MRVVSTDAPRALKMGTVSQLFCISLKAARSPKERTKVLNASWVMMIVWAVSTRKMVYTSAFETHPSRGNEIWYRSGGG